GVRDLRSRSPGRHGEGGPRARPARHSPHRSLRRVDLLLHGARDSRRHGDGRAPSRRGELTLMCGIAGIVRWDGGAVRTAEVEVMLDAILHRGPDASGMLEAPGVVAGIRRLRV